MREVAAIAEKPEVKVTYSELTLYFFSFCV